jgi:uncharacterized OB-fold protein
MSTVEPPIRPSSGQPSPQISPSPDAVPFWDGCRDGKLVLPRCRACDRFFFYPRSVCPRCGSRDIDWIPVSGAGTLHSFCIQHHSGVPGYVGATPFVTALVDLAEGPRMMSLLVGAGTDPESIRIGSAVRVVFIEGDSWPLPAFEPLDDGSPIHPAAGARP